MFSLLLDVIETIAIVVWKFTISMLKIVYEISGIPTTQYGLVKFVAENNIFIFNSAVLTKIIFFITPFIVSHILGYLTSLFGIKSFKVKEGISIFLYIMILYLFSSWEFWVIVSGTILILIVVYILKHRINRKAIN